MVGKMFSADLVRRRLQTALAEEQHKRSDTREAKPRASLPGAAFFAIPVALIFTAWLIATFGISLWWALPLYSLIGASVITLFAVLPRD